MASRMTRAVEARFWNLVNGPWCDERLDPYDDCWHWMGAVVKSRPPKLKLVKAFRVYGRFHLSVEVGLVNAHRAALLLTVGPPPEDGKVYVAAHRCDDSLCVHPGDLEWQTQQRNVADAMARGRLARAPDPSGRGYRWASTGVEPTQRGAIHE